MPVIVMYRDPVSLEIKRVKHDYMGKDVPRNAQTLEFVMKNTLNVLREEGVEVRNWISWSDN
eukprot:9367775-Lingulodinium_polyedra.AAC.1